MGFPFYRGYRHCPTMLCTTLTLMDYGITSAIPLAHVYNSTLDTFYCQPFLDLACPQLLNNVPFYAQHITHSMLT